MSACGKQITESENHLSVSDCESQQLLNTPVTALEKIHVIDNTFTTN